MPANPNRTELDPIGWLARGIQKGYSLVKAPGKNIFFYGAKRFAVQLELVW